VRISAEKGKRMIYEYTSPNGYKGRMYQGARPGCTSVSIRDKNGKEVFHTGFSNCKTFQDLKDEVDDFPEFLKRLTEEG